MSPKDRELFQLSGNGPETLRSADVLAGEIDQCFRHLPISLAAHAANSLILVAVLWGAVDGLRLLVWLGAILLVASGRLLLWRRYRNPERNTRISGETWRRLLVVGACAAGVVWGAAGVVLFHPSSFPHQVFLAFVLGGMVAGGIPLLSSIKSAYRCFAIPAVLPISLQFMAQGDRIHLIMGVMVLIFGAAMLVAATQVNRAYRDTVELRLQLVSSVKAGDALKQMVHVDELTGIANRRLFEQALEAEWRRAEREGATLAIVTADIDHFKAFNDYYGHPAGDRCLIRVAKSMAGSVLRAGDVAARVGGEEFAFLLPGTPIEAAAVVAERIRKNVSDLHLPHAASPVAGKVTVSLGVAAVQPNPGLSSQDLLHASDVALYSAKRRGRNRVICYS